MSPSCRAGLASVTQGPFQLSDVLTRRLPASQPVTGTTRGGLVKLRATRSYLCQVKTPKTDGTNEKTLVERVRTSSTECRTRRITGITFLVFGKFRL